MAGKAYKMASRVLSASRGSATCLTQEVRQYCTTTTRHATGLVGTQRRISRPAPCMMAETATTKAESRRQYAARPNQKFNPIRTTPKTKPRGAPKIPQSKPLPGDGAYLTEDSVPDSEWWDETRAHLIEKQGMAPDAAPLDSAGCISFVKRYIQASLDDIGNPLPWSSPSTVKKLTSMDFSPAHLHYIAVQLLALGEGDRPAPPPLMRLSLRMLDHASILDHDPSTVTLCLTAIKMASVDGGTKRRLSDIPPPFPAAINRFRARFRTSGAAAKDPDILTVWGLLHLFEDRLEMAERYLRLAMGPVLPAPTTGAHRRAPADADAAPDFDVDLKPRPPRFDAEPAACLALAKTTALMGRPEADTAACYAVGAFQLDLARACMMLGLLTGTAKVGGKGEQQTGGDWRARYVPYRELLITRAAMNGIPEACVAMVEIEKTKAASASMGITDLSACGLGSIQSPQHHDLVAAEWERVVEAIRARG
ncbi:hypothetical protein RB597_005034 [Gaeumannomyces tritici]